MDHRQSVSVHKLVSFFFFHLDNIVCRDMYNYESDLSNDSVKIRSYDYLVI